MAEHQFAGSQTLDLVSLLVDRSMVPATQQHEVRQRCGPALRPVPDVVPLPEPHTAAGEATALVPMLQRRP